MIFLYKIKLRKDNVSAGSIDQRFNDGSIPFCMTQFRRRDFGEEMSLEDPECPGRKLFFDTSQTFREFIDCRYNASYITVINDGVYMSVLCVTTMRPGFESLSSISLRR